MPVPTVVPAWFAERALRRCRNGLPFVASIGLFFPGFTELTISRWMHVARPSARMAQEFPTIGTASMLPELLLQACWSCRVFRGNVRGDVGYEHM
ncbi:hypothetical protein WT31_28245 [Burkholderia territorii]|nr:hypothetical protein WT31_28245 [Burkholderia territorii]